MATRHGGSLTDDALPAWVEELGIPGFFDVHVHFMPPPVMARVWEHFDAAGPLLGREWPIAYRADDGERVRILDRLRVRRFSALPYAHKPGIAGYLNAWAADFHRATGGNLWSATFYPEPGVGDDVRKLIADGVEIFKIHLQVGDFDPRDPLLDDVWAALSDSQTPIVIHAGHGPVPARFTGPEAIGDVLKAFPRLPMIAAHAGLPHYAEFLDFAERYENVRLDTTMVFTDFTERDAPFDPALLPRLRELQPKVLLGSDFPNIPYPYAHQIEALERLDLGDDWLRSVCWENAASLLG